MKDDSERNEEKQAEEHTSTDEATDNYLTGLQEREKLKKELYDLKKELITAKSQNYDLLKKVESLQQQLQSKKEDPPNERKKSRPATAGKGFRRPVKRKEKRKKLEQKGNKTETDDTPENVFESTENMYQFLADKFPDMPLSTILKAQKKFTETDIDGNGTVDAEELEAMLDTTNLLFTKKQVEEILKTIDDDNTNSLDFIECLTVLDQLRSNRKTNLPPSLQQQKSAICILQ